MRRKGVGLALVTVFFVGMLLLLPGPAAASNRYYATGAEVYNLGAYCGTDFTYPANTPFYVAHGYAEGPWTTDTRENKLAFLSDMTYFELQIDGVTQRSTMYIYMETVDDALWKMYVTENDRGLTDVHVFEGFFYLDSYWLGETPGQAVLVGTCMSTVTFV